MRDLEPFVRVPGREVLGGEVVGHVHSALGRLGGVVPKHDQVLVRVRDAMKSRAGDDFEQGAEMGVFEDGAEGGQPGGVSEERGQVFVQHNLREILQPKRRHHPLQFAQPLTRRILPSPKRRIADALNRDLQPIRRGQGEVGEGERLRPGIVFGQERVRRPVQGGGNLFGRGDPAEVEGVFAQGGDQRPLSGHRPEGERGAVRLPFQVKRGEGVVPVLESGTFPVIFVQLKRVIRPREKMHFQPGRVAPVLPVAKRDNRAGFGEEGQVVEGAVQGVPTWFVMLTGEEIPRLVRQPDDLPGQAGVRVPRGDERSGDQLASVGVLVGSEVGLFPVGVGVVHRADGGFGGGVVAPGHGVQVGDKPVAYLHGVAGEAQGFGIPPKRAAFVETVFGAVQAQNGTEQAVLHPARVEFGVFVPVEMPADVVAPPSVPDVGRGAGEVGLERQRPPRDDRVPGKANGVTVVAQPTPTREDEGAFGGLGDWLIS